MTLRDEKLSSIIREIAAKFINEESNRQSLITITRVDILDRGKKALILFTALPQASEADALKFLSRKGSDLRMSIADKKVVGFVPKIEFAIDRGEHNRQRIDELLNGG